MHVQANLLTVPIICTRGVVLFPQQDVMIEVGRQMSLDAVQQAQEHYDGQVFVVCQKDMLVEQPTLEDIYHFGSLCRIKSLRKTNGFVRVTFSGLERAVAENIDLETGFASIRLVSDIAQDEQEERILLRKIGAELEAMVPEQGNAQLMNTLRAQFSNGISAEILSDQFAQLFPMAVAKKQEFLEELRVNERLMMILVALEKEKQANELESQINEKVKERIEDGQKEYYLRERLRAIKEELGDVSNVTDDTATLRQMIEENPYPEHVKQKAREELARYETLPAGAGESGVIRTYLDWLLKTPWYQTSVDNEDLKLAQQRLDDEHYGLKKVKERIMEYLAVKQMTQSLNSPILCLVGPPGVGKTSLAKSVAHALDRKFVKASLGGVHDESEIRGHRRTYLGSMPGRFIQGMKKAGVLNPVFLIDEIDKMASDYKGDPSSAMLEVLDPEQNQFFSDHYLEEPYDLSQVLFIATANTLEDIPGPLRDRLEIIELSSYTEVEKVHIATDHLIAKQLKNTGLKSSQFKLNEAEIIYLIRHYTREAGVRQLERLIATLCRKSVLAILNGEKKSVKITKSLIQTWLGKERFEFGVKEKKDQVGVVTGLAYTSFGGDVLPVEVTYFDGKGKLIVTGQLGDVMKESTEIALDFIKSNAKKYGIEPAFFEKHDIHIHCPEGAVPKDGPSAGVTLTTALVSAITGKAVHRDLAMTGEVTLRGQVLAIGGLREKSLAAHRVGIKNIVIPKTNMKDLDEVPDVVKETVRFIPVDHVDQVLKEALI